MSVSTESRNRQIKRDACIAGLAPCHPLGTRPADPGDEEYRAAVAFNADRWAFALQAARADKATRAERAANDRGSFSIEFRAADYGLVPHATSTECSGCPSRQTIQRNAASVLRYRFGHRDQPAVYGRTVWAEAASA